MKKYARILNRFSARKEVLKFATIFAGVFLGCGLVRSTEFPGAKISNGLVQAELYMPDASNGYYQGTRFDWSGVIPKLEFKGHDYFGQWFDKYDPKLHDAIMGPVEEFTGLGFEVAPAGGEFLKIGVGSLIKPDDKNYSFARTYEIKNPGVWKIKKYKNKVEFIHTLTDAAGYSYIYKKTVTLLDGKPALLLEHSLKNTGQKSIETSVYNHNFFTIDGQQTGPDIKVSYPFNIKVEGKGFGDLALASNKSITYSRPLEKGENVYTPGVLGFANTPEDYDISIENLKTKAGVRITSDQSLEKLVFWACSTTSCPEPYIRIEAKPGQETRWNIEYEFYTF
jgi:hypothetical protein